MKKNFLIIFALGAILSLKAQRHELGISLGMPNLIADIGKTNYIQPVPEAFTLKYMPISIGALYRYNLDNRQSVRLNLSYNKVRFDDTDAREDYRRARGIRNENNYLIEAALLYEYYFFDINSEQYSGISPYIFGGVAAYGFSDRKYTINNQLYRDQDGNVIEPSDAEDFETLTSYKGSTKFRFSIPFGVGLKIKYKYNWIFSFEVGARYTGYDNLDYSNEEAKKFTVNINDNLLYDSPYVEVLNKRVQNEIGKRQTGNTINNKDWYVITSIGIAYTFGRPPCWCY